MGRRGWEGGVCSFVLFFGGECPALGAAGVWGAALGGMPCGCGCREMLWGGQGTELSHSLSC